MSKTQIINTVYGLICLVAALGAELGEIPFLPPRAKHYVAGASVVALWLKGHWNLFINPDGSPAAASYVKGDKN